MITHRINEQGYLSTQGGVTTLVIETYDVLLYYLISSNSNTEDVESEYYLENLIM